MSEKPFGGILAFAVAAPIMVICCGGGAVLLAGFVGGIGGWLTGLGGIATMVSALGAVLVWLEIRKRRAARSTGQKDTTSRPEHAEPDAGYARRKA